MLRSGVTDRAHIRALFAHGPRRGALFCVVVAAHMVGFLLFPALEGRRRAVESAKVEGPEDRMLIFFVQPRDFSEGTPARANLSKPVSKAARRPERPKPETPIAPLPPAAPEPSEPIDWAREAEIVAGASLSTKPERRSLGPVYDQTSPRGLTSGPQQKQFGWSHSRVHRIEPIEGGGTLFWINDRCALVMTVMLMPVCKFGKIEARGDLFEDMNNDSDGTTAPDPAGR
jgi:hypothetical protein